MTHAPLTLKRWSRVEFERLDDLGVFKGQPVELLGGQLVVAEPQTPRHTAGIAVLDDALRAALPTGWLVRTEERVALDDDSEPEPDLAVVNGGRGDYREALPMRPALVAEVAEVSLGFDRLQKGGLYARAGVRDYWLVNLVDRVVEVYRQPVPNPSAPYGWRYQLVDRLTPGASVGLLALPSVRLPVAPLLS